MNEGRRFLHVLSRRAFAGIEIEDHAIGQSGPRIDVNEDYELRLVRFTARQHELKAGTMRTWASLHCARNGPAYMPQRSAAVCTGASQSCFNSSVSMHTVMEQPAISREVT